MAYSCLLLGNLGISVELQVIFGICYLRSRFLDDVMSFVADFFFLFCFNHFDGIVSGLTGLSCCIKSNILTKVCCHFKNKSCFNYFDAIVSGLSGLSGCIKSNTLTKVWFLFKNNSGFLGLFNCFNYFTFGLIKLQYYLIYQLYKLIVRGPDISHKLFIFYL